MTTTGSLKEAAELAALIIPGNWGGKKVDRDKLPKGWKFLGAGSWREAYLSPSGVVYKIDKDGNSNEKEARRYRRVGQDESRGFRFARCTYWKSQGVLAMEYVKDDNSDADESHRAMTTYLHRLGYRDCAEYSRKSNWHGVKGVAVITDYAYGYDERIY